jgi:hypothetical protein
LDVWFSKETQRISGLKGNIMGFDWFKELKKRQKELQTQIQKEGQANLKEVFEEFLTKNPIIKGIAWTQYTPYFNDGEECVFSVNDPVFLLQEYDHDEDVYEHEEPPRGFNNGNIPGDWELGKYKENPNDGYYKNKVEFYQANKKAMDNAQRFYKKIWGSDDIFETIFGDHVTVVFENGEFDVQEYGHD